MFLQRAAETRRRRLTIKRNYKRVDVFLPGAKTSAQLSTEPPILTDGVSARTGGATELLVRELRLETKVNVSRVCEGGVNNQAVMRRYGTESEPEPWIEQLIQNYGGERRDVSVRAHVVGVRL